MALPWPCLLIARALRRERVCWQMPRQTQTVCSGWGLRAPARPRSRVQPTPLTCSAGMCPRGFKPGGSASRGQSRHCWHACRPPFLSSGSTFRLGLSVLHDTPRHGLLACTVLQSSEPRVQWDPVIEPGGRPSRPKAGQETRQSKARSCKRSQVGLSPICDLHIGAGSETHLSRRICTPRLRAQV